MGVPGRRGVAQELSANWLLYATKMRYSPAMGRKRFTDMNCGIAQALEALGDWWTLLIVRDAFFGVRRFGDFEAQPRHREEHARRAG